MGLAALAGVVGMSAAGKSGLVDRIEPPYWWVGMQNDTLQLMVSGPGVATADFTVSYPGVRLLEQTRLDSDNYKFLYLLLSPETRPGDIQLTATSGKKSQKINYTLRARDRKPEEYKGFDSSDVLYLLMPDRFAKGSATDAKTEKKRVEGLNNPVLPDRTNPNGRHGGDVNGIVEHLDYLDSLGVTAIWVCPVLENDMRGGSYHGYATTDYYRIDPRFGTNEEWENLIAEAHKRGMKVVMDMIFNHCGSGHPWMQDSPSADWFNHPEGTEMTNYRLTTVHDPYASDYDRDHTVNAWFVPSMPDLNQRNPHLMRYLTQNSIWWVESSKVDGIRMDTYPYADMKGMSDWAADVLKEYPNFNIVGECWYSNEAGPAFWQSGSRLNPQETHLPTVMDFWFILNGRKAFSDQTDPWNGLNNVYDHLAYDFLYPDPQKILTFLDNHDTDRFLAEIPEDLGSWKQAVTFLLTTRGIPQLYYGTELLMNGSKEGSDGYVRLDFPGGFPGDTTDAFTRAGRTDIQNEAWDYLSALLNWRRGAANEVIAKGTLKHFMPQNGVYTYQRRLGDKSVTVMMNGNDTPLTISTERTLEILPLGTRQRDLLTGEEVEIAKELSFGPRQIYILQNF